MAETIGFFIAFSESKLLAGNEVWQDGPMGIKAGDFKRMQERLGGAKRKPVSPEIETLAPPALHHRTIIGIDPSLRGTGYGVIRQERTKFTALDHGTIKCPAHWEGSRCLAMIGQTVRALLEKHRPDVCVMEGLFFAQNMRTALTMGQARGASLAVIAEHGLGIFEISPRKVKQAIVGYGAAQKEAVAKMVQRLLKLEKLPEPDAADALAVALALTQEQGRYSISSLKRI